VLLASLLIACRANAVPAAEAQCLPADWQRGANVTALDPDAYGTTVAADALAALKATGTDRAALVPTWYMATATSSEVRPEPVFTSADDALRKGARTARSLGMQIVIKPHVDVLDGTFRGDIAPASRSRWWQDYTAMLRHYAELAEQEGAAMLEIGTELTSMSADEQRWRALIADVRTRFTGELTFAANWIDGARAISFWDALDAIGIDAYMPVVTDEPDPSVARLVKAWERHGYIAQLEELSRRHRRPVLFTELGYRSRLGTAAAPWEWSTAGGPIAQGPQARAYQAAFEVFAGRPWFRGIYWWDWSAQGWNSEVGDGSHRFAGKKAEAVVRAWHSAPPRAERMVARVVRARRAWRLMLIGAPCRRATAIRILRAAGRRALATMHPRIRAGRLTAALARSLRPGRYRARVRFARSCRGVHTATAGFTLPSSVDDERDDRQGDRARRVHR
jgi:hypothetical protein